MNFTYSHHLVGLLARGEAASSRLAGSDPARRRAMAAASRRQAARLSARLDGSPLTDAIADAVDRTVADGRPLPQLAELPEDPGTGWARALKLDAMDTDEVAAVEYGNLLALAPTEADMAARCMAEPRQVLDQLHGIICQGLVDPAVIGRPRTTVQAIHDGAQGMVLYNPTAPEQVEAELEGLCDWLVRRTIVLSPTVVAGVAHERLLEIQPYEAGNGRVARAFARLILMAGGVDVDGVAVPEAQWWADATAYYAEVAATIRRGGDLSIWLERHTAGVTVAIEQAADQLDPRPLPELPARGTAVIARTQVGRTVNLREYARDAGVGLRQARAELAAFARAGQVSEEPGGGGLVFRRLTARAG